MGGESLLYAFWLVKTVLGASPRFVGAIREVAREAEPVICQIKL